MDFKRIRLILHLHRHHQYHDASSFLILYGFFCFCCFCIASSRAADPITELKPGQKLDDGQLLVSPSHNFILGFFTKGASDGRYLGIQLNTSFGSLNPVWIANREKAIPDTNGLLSLDANGILRLVRDGENLTFLNSNPASTPISNRLTAILLDSGNFVLKEINGAGVERFLWQSFDYPADTLLPGMKLSISKSNSGRNRSLTSWVSNKVLYPGAFTLGLHPNTNQLLIQRRGETYWRSGGWDGRQFQLVPHLTSRDSYSVLLKDHIKFSYVDDQDERYFSYDYSGVDLPILFWVLNSSGGLQSYEIIRQNELVSSLNLIGCNGNDGASSSAGCEKQKLPSCRTGNEQFQERRGTMEGGGPPTSPVFGNDSISDCDTRCRRNCSCIAYAPYDSESQIGCQFWFTGSRFIENAGSGSNVIYLLSSPHEGKEWWMWLIISGGVVSAMLLLVSLAYFWWKKGKREENDEDLLLEFGTISSSQEQRKGTPEFQVFSYDNIASATDNFSPTKKLGEGGFGPVYKGKLHEGQEIAVKRLSKMSGQGLKEFKNEIMLIAKLQHMNLVRLLGCSIKGEEKMLIYEYMPNKSLDSFLFDPAGRQLLDWTKRRNIIEGIAQGLLYLHKYSRLRVIHRDLKASNILLDAELNPKISDFGMAKIFGHNDSEANTNRIVGTYGYMAPEYAMEGIFSVKSDVFSFGVLLLEIISGRKNSGFNRSDSHINLIGYAWDLWQKKAGIELLDPTLASSCSEESFLRYFHVGLLCVQESAADRPTMLDVVSMLTSETASLPAPGQPAFSTARILLVEEEQDSNSKPESCSKNGLTISVMEAR